MAEDDPGADPPAPHLADRAPEVGQPLPAWQPPSRPDSADRAPQVGPAMLAWKSASLPADDSVVAPPRASSTKKYVVGAAVILAVGSVVVIALFTPKLTPGQKDYVAYVTAKGVRPPDLDDDLVAQQGQAFCDQIKNEGVDKAVSLVTSVREQAREGLI